MRAFLLRRDVDTASSYMFLIKLGQSNAFSLLDETTRMFFLLASPAEFDVCRLRDNYEKPHTILSIPQIPIRYRLLTASSAAPGREFVLGFLANRVLIGYPVARVSITSFDMQPVDVAVSLPGMAYGMLWPGADTQTLLRQTFTLQRGGSVVVEYPYPLHMTSTSVEFKGDHFYCDLISYSSFILSQMRVNMMQSFQDQLCFCVCQILCG